MLRRCFSTSATRFFPRLKSVHSVHKRILQFGEYDRLEPALGWQKPDMADVPLHIPRPPYIGADLPSDTHKRLALKTPDEIERIHRSCQLAKKTLATIRAAVRPGVTTNFLDHLARDFIISHGAYPSPLGYQGFMKSICTSVNNVVCHGIPDDRPLLPGDLVSVDVTAYLNGFHGDTCATFSVEDEDNGILVDEPGRLLCERAQEITMAAINACRPGVPISVIGNTISSLATKYGYTVVDIACGHGIGRDFHEAPLVLHHRNEESLLLEPGMVFTVEPAICQGFGYVQKWSDGWTVATMDGGRCAQFEHTITITQDGVLILTL